jgi:hypothetical protein
MADKKISELNNITGNVVDDSSDEIPIVDSSVDETKRITREELFKSVRHANAYQTRAEAISALPSLPVESYFWVGDLQFQKVSSSSAISDMSNVIPVGDVYVDHFGENTTPGTTGVSSDILAGATYADAQGGGQILFQSGSTYLLDSTILFDTLASVDLHLESGAIVKQGASAFPGIELRDCRNCTITGNGTFDGNFTEAGVYDDLLITAGITSGVDYGTASATYAIGVTSITINDLGVGYIVLGDQIEFLISGTAYRYVVQADAQITAGTATVTLDRGLDVEVTPGQTLYVKSWRNRQYLQGASSAGSTTITLGAADVSSATTAELKAGDQFAFHTDSNDIDSIDYTEIYTVTADATYSGSYPNVTATVTITPALATNKANGQMVTSIQDYRNNKHALLLLTGCDDCSVENIIIDDCQSHGVALNATINAPWAGRAITDNENTDCAIIRCQDKGGRTGTAFGAGRNKRVRIEGNRGSDGAGTRNFIQAERTIDSQIHGNICVGYKSGAQVTGEADRISISGNTFEGCNLGIDVRTITRSMIVTGNTVTAGASTSYHIKVQAGYNIDAADEGTANALAIVSNNQLIDAAAVSGTYNGSSIIIQSNQASIDFDDMFVPHHVIVSENFIYRPGRHGVQILQGVACDVTGNHILVPGYSGVSALLCDMINIRDNTVIDAGQTVASAAYYIDGSLMVGFRGNVGIMRMSSSPQTYGLETSGTVSFSDLGNNVLSGASGAYSTSNDVSNVRFGLSALEDLADGGVRNSAFGLKSLGNVTTGDANLGAGSFAGETLTTGNRNTFLGDTADVDVGTRNNCIAIGQGAIAERSGELSIGSTSATILTTTSATAGANGDVPAQVVGYIDMRLNGMRVKVPYYDA